ncbi:MAG: hypothetical protein FWB96_05815 [Defluviitaleaceae bacterium]|nr:hypothetical protein [Defluviitaleaceae bacterium]MCL2262313.1 hypothetical protein [Defluviitaleaceae bacterium]
MALTHGSSALAVQTPLIPVTSGGWFEKNLRRFDDRGKKRDIKQLERQFVQHHQLPWKHFGVWELTA